MDLILTVIIACEVGFWVFVVCGLLARYIVRWPRTGIALLAMTPVIDLVLLVAVIISLSSGGSATVYHGLAAIYLGISIAYGHKIINGADVRFAHRFAQGPTPVKLYGSEYAKASGRTSSAPPSRWAPQPAFCGCSSPWSTTPAEPRL